jgi:hypothetical protein
VCPFLLATANWISADEFAVWEAGRPVQVWKGGKKSVLAPIATDLASQYRTVTAVGPGTGANNLTLIDAVSGRALEYNDQGGYISSKDIPPLSQLSSWGFSGATPVWQLMETSSDNLTAEVIVRAGRTIGDSTARTAFRANLDWLHLLGGTVTAAPPLFPNSVVFAFAPNGDVIWSDGNKFTLERDGSKGKPIWQVTSNISGPAIDSIDITKKRAELSEPGSAFLLRKEMLDSMEARTRGRNHPAINGLLLSPNGSFLVTRAIVPQRDSVGYVRFTGDGTPVDRFMLPKNTQLVLFGNDSILVHEYLDNQPKALVWLYLKP